MTTDLSLSAAASQGDCKSSALAAAAGSAWTQTDVKFDSVVANTVMHAVVGGVTAELGGGKFENGAVTGAFGYLFNDLAHEKKKSTVINGYVGAGGSVMVGPMYLSADSGFSVDTDGTACITSNLCSGVGWNSIPGGSLGIVTGGGPGRLSSGEQTSKGAYVGPHQATYSDGNVQYGRALLSPLNVGGGAGYISCTTTSICNK